MAEFTRTTSPLTGKEKAAVLFVSLGRAAWSGVTGCLSRKDLKKLRLAIKRTRYGLSDEYEVLQEVEQYGLRHGIWPQTKRPVHKVDISVGDSERADTVRQTANERPDEVAKLIGQWLGGEDGKH